MFETSLHALQAKNETTMLELALKDLKSSRRQRDAALEASVGDFKTQNCRAPRALRQRALAAHDQGCAVDDDFELVRGHTRQRDQYPQLVAGLVQIDRRLPGRRALRGAQLEKLALQPFSGLQQIQGLSP